MRKVPDQMTDFGHYTARRIDAAILFCFFLTGRQMEQVECPALSAPDHQHETDKVL